MPESPMDNSGAPVIPAGTKMTGGFAYDPLQASRAANQGQGQQVPVSEPQQAAPVVNAPYGQAFAELAAKKGFKSPDDLVQAYEALESHNKKVEMTATDILKSVYPEQPTQVAPQIVQNPAVAPSDAQAIQIVENIAKNVVKPLEERVALQDLFLKSPDAKDFAEGMATAVKSNPGITWENAYKIAKFDAAQKQAVVQGRTEAYQSIEQKNAAIVGTSQPNVKTGPDVRNVIRDRSVPFREVDRMVREALTSYQQ